MKTEYEKMISGELYCFADEEVLASVKHANELCCRLQTMTLHSPDYRAVVEALIPGIPASSSVNPPFHCDHSTGITMGEHVFLNYNCTVLDGGKVSFGNFVKVGPDCRFFTAQHPMDFQERRKPMETCLPIIIGDDTWIGGGVTVCPGVTIGARCIIAAGAVVVRDIPDDCMAAGNPAVVKKHLY